MAAVNNGDNVGAERGAQQGQGTPPGGRERSSQSLIQIAFPDKANLVFYAAIVLGLVLICLPTVFRSYFVVNGTHSNLVLCIGAALVLAAFGGQATIRVGSFILAGVAAIAFGLFWTLEKKTDSLFLKGTVYAFDYVAYESMDSAQRSVLGKIVRNRVNPKRSSYEFVVFKKDIDTQKIEIALTQSDTKREQVLSVDVGDMEWAFGNPRKLEWDLVQVTVDNERVLTLRERFRNKEVAREAIEGPQRQGSGLNWPALGLRLTSSAMAQSAPNPGEIALNLERLKSDDTGVRRDARDALSTAPVDAIPTIMQTFREQYKDYRIRLGVTVALTQMLRADKSKNRAISEKLVEPDVALLVDAVGDPDRTVRVYATEFLFDLGDPRATQMAIRRAASTKDDSARYNWLFAAQDGWRKVPAADKSALAPVLSDIKQSGGKAGGLVDRFR